MLLFAPVKSRFILHFTIDTNKWRSRTRRATKNHNYTVDWLFKKMKYLGHLIDLDMDAANEYIEFQDVLDNFAFNETTGLFESNVIMDRVYIIIRYIRRNLKNCVSTRFVLILFCVS